MAGVLIGWTPSVVRGRTDGSSACGGGVPGRRWADVQRLRGTGWVQAPGHPGYHRPTSDPPSHRLTNGSPTYLVLWTILTKSARKYQSSRNSTVHGGVQPVVHGGVQGP